MTDLVASRHALAPSLTVDQGRVEGSPPLTRKKHVRVDIQVLRALAILLVLAHHARLPFVPGGFLGVDIFFVISGYLMTGLIDEGLANGRFTFAEFYARRIRRLLPASCATLAVTALLAPFLLDSVEMRAFAGQLAGAFLFAANMVLWQQSDYFSGGAALKPLLHMWSLAVEEQFYIVLPVLLWATPARWRLSLVAILTVSSIALCLVMLPRSPSATFYFLPTRAWELGIGAMVALAVRRGIVLPGAFGAARLVAAAMLIGLPLVTSEAGHPGWPALLACLATALLVVPGADLNPARRLWRGLGWVGDRSYSLYLVHWPVFAFANHLALRAPPPAVNLALVALCLVWMELQFRLVEQRFRNFRVGPSSLLTLAAIAAIAIGGTALAARAGSDAITAARGPNPGLSPRCDYHEAFGDLPECRTGPGARTLVWGDSFAMALADGLAASSPHGIVQATRTVCGPFAGIAPVNGGQYSAHWGRSCIAFNESVLAWLARHPEVDTVVMSSALVQYVPGAEAGGWQLMSGTPRAAQVGPQSRARLEAALRQTVDRLAAMGKKSVLFAPPPSIDFDTGRCLDRLAKGKPLVGAPPGCRFARADYDQYRAPTRGFLADARMIAPVIELEDDLCGDADCRVALPDGTPLYRDEAHLSAPGSAALGREMIWGRRVAAAAR